MSLTLSGCGDDEAYACGEEPATVIKGNILSIDGDGLCRSYESCLDRCMNPVKCEDQKDVLNSCQRALRYEKIKELGR